MSTPTTTTHPDPHTTPAALEARSLVVQRGQAATDQEREALSARVVEHQRATGWRYWPAAYRSARGFWTAPGGTVLDRIWDDAQPAIRMTTTTTTTEQEA